VNPPPPVAPRRTPGAGRPGAPPREAQRSRPTSAAPPLEHNRTPPNGRISTSVHSRPPIRRRRRAQNDDSGPSLKKSSPDSLPPTALPPTPVPAQITLVNTISAPAAPQLSRPAPRTSVPLRNIRPNFPTKEDSAPRRRKRKRDDIAPAPTHAATAAAHACQRRRSNSGFGPRPPAVTPVARGVITHGGPSCWLPNRHVSATATQHPAEVPPGAPPPGGALPSDGPIIYVVSHRYTNFITPRTPEATRS